MKFRSLKQLFEPYIDVIIFMITLVVANYFWKFTIMGDEEGEMVTWFGMDITAPFEWLSAHIAAAVYWCVSLFRDTVYMVGEHTIRFQSGSATSIVWSCSGLKQMFIFLCLILTTRGGWVQKSWFIPLGWVICHVFNILRIVLITFAIEYHPDWFEILHDHIFKYLFYAMMFGLWVWFVERIRPQEPTATSTNTTEK